MSESTNTLIALKDVSFERGARQILRDIDLTVSAKEIVTLIGPNGSGKTTIVRIALGLLQADAGTVTRAPNLRIGYMPQRMSVDPVMPITVSRFVGLGNHKGSDNISATLQETGCGDIADLPVQAISGGEQQRVLLARALLREPDLLVLDEPAQGVDITGQHELYQLITTIRDRRGCGVLMVSHDLHLVMAATDNVICLNNHICCSGHPEAVTQDPAYLDLFGEHVAAGLAVYTHHHDHQHDVRGDIAKTEDHAHG